MQKKNWIQRILLMMIGCLGSFNLAAEEAPSLLYASPIGDEHWRMTGNRLRCGLSFLLPNYGMAYFEQYAASQPRFILTQWQQTDKYLPAVISASTPVWKPRQENYLISKVSIAPGEYGLFLKKGITITILNYLSRGYQTNIKYRSEQGFPIKITLSPINFQKKYALYQRCLGNLLPFTYEAVKTSILYFPTDGMELDDNDKRQLNKVAEYVKADADVKKVYIAGYADSRGRKSYNNAVSEIRAKAVKKYLLEQGVAGHLIFITWFGASKPFLVNDNSADDMAQNRRVMVEIRRKIRS